ncbi:MAG: hypothetical protein ACLFT3_00895 [Cyclobacteriaceae bacterium]
MIKLEEDWLTQGLIDFEYKKYMLLAYVQQVRSQFNEKRLYPFLSDLVFHYNNLIRIKEKKQLLFENFPRQITKADFEKLKLSYENIVKDDELMSIIAEVIGFALPRMKKELDTGAELYEEIARHISIEPIGIAPLFKQEGYLFICENDSKQTRIYKYKITIFNHHEESFRGISTEFVEEQERNLVNTLEKMKITLIQKYQAMPNPATFAAFSRLKCPMEETLLPITKRLLVQHIGQAA